MGLFDFLSRLIFGSPASHDSAADVPPTAPEPSRADAAPKHNSPPPKRPSRIKNRTSSTRPVRLVPLRYVGSLVRTPQQQELTAEKPYPFASRNLNPRTGEDLGWLDLSTDGDERWLQYYSLPILKTPTDLAQFLGIPLGRLAWLTQRRHSNYRPATIRESHYHYRWITKRSGGHRLIEAPKQQLKQVQQKILSGILDRVPAHPSAHGFVAGRSILTNAQAHVGKRFLLKLDLEDFYTTVRYRRVVAIFRSLGYSREVALWLSRLTTSAVPREFVGPDSRPGWHHSLSRYALLHLPQGAPTSPALANLSAYALDVRLAGIAGAYDMDYSRYADDLTFSGEGRSIPALQEFVPLVQQIIRAERFRPNRSKRRVVRDSQRQIVAGVVVNERTNVARKDYDLLKAILHNCMREGPSSQNRYNLENFAEHLRGRIAHVTQLNPERGARLLEMYLRIDWNC
ncbi:MAG: RNA-directed DNA polymerase [Planctomycetaceae bacterium]|nr:RNA-directed DNA polymerase [Planctomycetaceae bacterium]